MRSFSLALLLSITTAVAFVTVNTTVTAADPDVIDISGRRELFVDHFLIDKLDRVRLQMMTPRDEGIAFAFDKPWEGPFCAYATIVTLENGHMRAYYRGKQRQNADGSEDEVTCVAESTDGVTWTKPELSLYEIMGEKKNNVVLTQQHSACHNFSPFLDSRPGVPAEEKFKAFGGTQIDGGIWGWISADGLSWKVISDKPIITTESVPFLYRFDSQNIAFWSPVEKKYIAYYRVFENKFRRIARSESNDFIHWSEPVLMEYRHLDGDAPIEHLYTNQTHPYFRAPHIYVALAARFMQGRQVLTPEQAAEIKVNPKYFKDTSDAIFMTTRPGEGGEYASHYDRTFLEGFVRGGIGIHNWVSRTNYPALNVVPTGPEEISFYVNQDYAQPTSHLRRYSLRTDGFASLHSDYDGGHAITKTFQFSGNRLSINFSTSAAGGTKFGFETPEGKPIPDFSIDDCHMQIGNELDRIVAWKKGTDLSSLAGKPLRLRISMKDVDLFSMQFVE